MSPIVGYHASLRKCRESIRRNGLIPNKPMYHRPFGVYVFRPDGEWNHTGWNSMCEWDASCGQDIWRAAYIGPLTMDHYVLNAFIFLGSVTDVTLVTGNQ